MRDFTIQQHGRRSWLSEGLCFSLATCRHPEVEEVALIALNFKMLGGHDAIDAIKAPHM